MFFVCAPQTDAVATYPLKVVYCGVCGVPPEYCCFGPDWERCQVWIAANCPELMPRGDSKPAAMAAGGASGAGAGSGAGSAAVASDAPSGAEGASSATATADGGDVVDGDGALGDGGGGDSDDDDGDGSDDGDSDDLAALGSKGRRKQKKSVKPDPAKALITISKNERKRNKWITTIGGVESFGGCAACGPCLRVRGVPSSECRRPWECERRAAGALPFPHLFHRLQG